MKKLVNIEINDGTVTAFLSGEIDHHTSAQIRREIDLTIERVRPDVLRLDFNGVQFMDSSGIGLIMGRYRQMSLLGGSVSVENIPKHLERLVRLSGITALGVMK